MLHGRQKRRYGSLILGVSAVDTSPLTVGRVTMSRISVAISSSASRTGMPASLSGLAASKTRLRASASDSGETAAATSATSARR